ncbi:MAG TPA: MlaD family protein [Solirubrobacteraceae bacterium]|nr:MlaD family protein [Solirubrobacteraceae bacterium]
MENPDDSTVAPAGPPPPDVSLIARLAAVAALAVAIVVVVLVLFGGGPSYTVKINFQDASGLVTGDLVMVGPANVGSVQSIGLAPNGAAQIVIGVDSDAAPLHQGTIARIYENSLSGIANKYVTLSPGPQSASTIPSGGTIPEQDTYANVSLDQVFDTLNGATRNGLRGFIRGEAASIQGKSAEANKTLEYLAPALSSTSNVTAELTRSEPTFDGLLVQGAQTMQQLASRTSELTQLVSNGNAATGAIASQSNALQRALALLPGALNHSTSTFAGLRTTLDALDPLVRKSIPQDRRLEPFARALKNFSRESIPVLAQLSGLLKAPPGVGDLTTLLQATPSLARIAIPAFPRMIAQMNYSQPQVDYFREYTPDVVAALSNLGQLGAYYDANGHYARTQPVFNAFSVNSSNQLEPIPSFATRDTGLQVVKARCPGAAVQPTADGSAPWAVPGCDTSSTPPGP